MHIQYLHCINIVVKPDADACKKMLRILEKHRHVTKKIHALSQFNYKERLSKTNSSFLEMNRLCADHIEVFIIKKSTECFDQCFLKQKN